MDYNGEYIFEAGVFGASDVYKLMGAQKGVNAVGAQTHILSKAAEQVSGFQQEVYGAPLDWGTLYEPQASQYYALAFECEVIKPFPQKPEWSDEVRCSPDGIVDGVKGLEIKCPYTTVNHFKHMLIHSIEDLKKEAVEYYWQIQMNLLIYEFDKWDFVSFDPRFTGWMRMHVVEIGRAEKDIILLKESLLQAVEMKNEFIRRIML